MPEGQRELGVLMGWNHTKEGEADASVGQQARPPMGYHVPRHSPACLPRRAAIWQPFPPPRQKGPLQECDQLGCFGSQEGRSDKAIQVWESQGFY